MYKPKCLWSWALVLLTVCWSGTLVFGQNPAANATPGANANANNKQTPQRPVKILTNPNIQLRQNAMDELARAIDARSQTDRQFKRYMDAVNKYNNDMNETVKAKRGHLK